MAIPVKHMWPSGTAVGFLTCYVILCLSKGRMSTSLWGRMKLQITSPWCTLRFRLPKIPRQRSVTQVQPRFSAECLLICKKKKEARCRSVMWQERWLDLKFYVLYAVLISSSNHMLATVPSKQQDCVFVLFCENLETISSNISCSYFQANLAWSSWQWLVMNGLKSGRTPQWKNEGMTI